MTKEEQSAAFRAMWKQVITPAFEFVNRLIDAEEPPEHLIHFTDAGGLLGIIKNKKLWLSRAFSSNDPKELKHGMRLARAELLRRVQSEKDLDEVAKEILLSFEGKRSDGVEGWKIDPHNCCFTSDDSVRRIGHWAMYGRNGAGFALRFRSKALADGPVGGIKPVKGSFAKVLYNLSEQKERTAELVQLAINKCLEAAQYAADKYGDDRQLQWRFVLQAAQGMGRIIAAHTATMKGPEFKAEKEWRLVNLGLLDKADGSIAAGSILRTYYEFPFDPDVLETVFVGRAQAKVNLGVTEKLLDDHGFAKTKVKVGKVELRPLS